MLSPRTQPAPISMDYWPSSRWKIAIAGKRTEHWIEPSLPFALIGSHPCCAVRLDSPRIPPLAYFAASFDDSIEVWPLVPIAFARWGVTLPEHPLAIGKKRVYLFHESCDSWKRVAHRGEIPTRSFHAVGKANNVTRQITVDWDGKPRAKSLSRRVTIIGNNHPSTLRLYGQDLAICDHAIVCVGGCVWAIDLNPPSQTTDCSELVRRITSMSDPIVAGRVRIRLGAAIEMTARHQQGVPNEVFAPIRTETSTVEEDHSLQEEFDDSEEPDRLTSKVTDRLVSIDQSRFSRGRLLRAGMFVLLFSTAAVILTHVIFEYILPMIAEHMIS